VRNNSQTGLVLSGNCEANLRRTVVRANNNRGVSIDNATLRAQNSAISRNADGGPGIYAIDATFEITYSVLAGNNSSVGPDTMVCLTAPSGFVRNSIVAGMATNSVSNCGALTWETNAVDTAGLGASNESVGAYQAGWFLAPNDGDFRLTASGQSEFENIAQWQDGDPLTDIEMNPIPTEVESYAGYHQPQ
jgi:hypothetical protein